MPTYIDLSELVIHADDRIVGGDWYRKHNTLVGIVAFIFEHLEHVNEKELKQIIRTYRDAIHS